MQVYGFCIHKLHVLVISVTLCGCCSMEELHQISAPSVPSCICANNLSCKICVEINKLITVFLETNTIKCTKYVDVQRHTNPNSLLCPTVQVPCPYVVGFRRYGHKIYQCAQSYETWFTSMTHSSNYKPQSLLYPMVKVSCL